MAMSTVFVETIDYFFERFTGLKTYSTSVHSRYTKYVLHQIHRPSFVFNFFGKIRRRRPLHKVCFSENADGRISRDSRYNFHRFQPFFYFTKKRSSSQLALLHASVFCSVTIECFPEKLEKLSQVKNSNKTRKLNGKGRRSRD